MEPSEYLVTAGVTVIRFELGLCFGEPCRSQESMNILTDPGKQTLPIYFQSFICETGIMVMQFSKVLFWSMRCDSILVSFRPISVLSVKERK